MQPFTLRTITHKGHAPTLSEGRVQLGKGSEQKIQAFLRHQPGHRKNLLLSAMGRLRILVKHTGRQGIGQQFQPLPIPHLLQSLQHALGVGRHHIGSAVVHTTQPAPETIHRLPSGIIAFRHHQMNRQIPSRGTAENVGFAEQCQHPPRLLLNQQVAQACVTKAANAFHAAGQQRVGQSTPARLQSIINPGQGELDAAQQHDSDEPNDESPHLDQLGNGEAPPACLPGTVLHIPQPGMEGFRIWIHVQHGHVVGQPVLDRMLRSKRQHPNLEPLCGEMFCCEQADFLSAPCSEMRQHHPEIIHGSVPERHRETHPEGVAR